MKHDPNSATAIGADRLDRLAASPDSFLLGLDEYDNVIPEAFVYHQSVADYETFLGMTSASGGVLDDTKQEQVRWSNASDLFEP